MEKKLYTVTDLGPGDGGKGGVVDKICDLKKAHTVIKIGGAQGSHGVRTSAGQSFNFSQFGCGTFRGSKTYVSELMLIAPHYFIDEGLQLKKMFGINNIFDTITIDKQALCLTPFHAIASQLRELDLKENPRGTVGLGAGEAKLDSELYPELAIYAKDLSSHDLKNKLEAVKDHKLKELAEIINRSSNFLPSDKVRTQNLLKMLNDKTLISKTVEWFKALSSLVKITDEDYLSGILKKDGTIVVESSHGILTDRYYGFTPHTSRLRTTPEATLKLLSDYNYDGQIIKLGVSRAYQIRHGAGPMVTESTDWLEKILSGSSKDENRWQGKVRIGPLDLVALKYAIDVCGGPEFFDGLAISWFDQIQAIGQWQLCSNYQDTNDSDFFSHGKIKVCCQGGAAQLAYQEQLTKQLFNCRPNITSYDVRNMSQSELIKFSSKILQDELKIPLKMISLGPTELDKICL
jgi:adenylosuccinate synthase